MRCIIRFAVLQFLLVGCSEAEKPPQYVAPSSTEPAAPQFAPQIASEPKPFATLQSNVAPIPANADISSPPIHRISPPPTAPPLTTVVSPPDDLMEEADATIPLPGEVSDVVVGGGGKYLLLVMQSLQKVGIFDVSEAKMSKYVNVAGDKFFVAGGANQFVVVDADNNTLEAWTYDSGDKPRLRQAFDMSGRKQLMGAVMGMSSEGPLALSFNYEKYGPRQPYVELFDLTKLTPLKYVVDWKSRSSSFSPRDPGESVLASSQSGSGVILIRDSHLHPITFDGTTMTVQPEQQIGNSGRANDPLLPFFDLKTLFHGQKTYLPDGRVVTLKSDGGQLSPAIPSQFFVTGLPVKNRTAFRASFYVMGDEKPAATLQLNVPAGFDSPPKRDRLHPSKRMFFNVTEKTLIVLPAGSSDLVVKRFDMEQAVTKAGRSMLQVTSEPPTEFISGKKLEYAIQATSNQGGLAYRLEAGPKGMTVSPEGRLEWTPADDAPAAQTAIVAVSDKSGKLLFHNMRLKRGTAPIVEVAADSSAPVDPNALHLSIKLPAPADDFVVGAGGRYLLAPMTSLRQIAVIDVKERKIAKLLPGDDEVKIAAGATRFVVASPNGSISRWNYRRFERELTTPLPTKIESICMGSASEGPILISPVSSTMTNPVFLDLNTLRPSKLKAWNNRAKEEAMIQSYTAAASNGRTFTSWRKQTFPIGILSYVVRGEQAVLTDRHLSAGPPIPSPDGSIVYTFRGTFSSYAADARSGYREPDPAARLALPAASGTYYLSWPNKIPAKDGGATKSVASIGTVTLHVQGSNSTILSIPDIDPPPTPRAIDDSDPLYSRRLLYVPVADAIVALGPTAESITIHRFSVEEALAKLKTDYLFVTSAPPAEIPPATRLNYQIEVKSRKGGLKFTLATGPSGAQLSSTGLLTWPIHNSVSGPQSFAILVGDDAGLETMHSFNIVVDKDASKPETSTPTAVATSGVAQGTASVPSSAVAQPNGDGAADLGKRPKTTLPLPGPIERLCVGGGGRYLVGVLKSLRQVAVIDIMQKTVVKVVSIDDDDVRVAACATTFVVLQKTKGILSRYDLATGARQLSVALPSRQIHSLAMGCDSDGPLLATIQDKFGAQPMLLDLQTLTPFKLDAEIQNSKFGAEICVSADGQIAVFGRAQCRIRKGKIEVLKPSTSGSDGRDHFVSSDGRIFYVSYGGMSAVGGNRLGDNKPSGGFLPAAVGPLYLSFPSGTSPDQPLVASLCMQGETQSIVTLHDLEFPQPASRDADLIEQPARFQRFFFLPTANAVACLSKTNDALIIQRLNFDETLKTIEGDYLLVASVAPTAVHPASSLQYSPDVRSKAGRVKYRLESGPPGTTISPEGLISWKAEGPDDEEKIIIAAISDASGKELFHTFRFRVDSDAPQKPAVGSALLVTATVANTATVSTKPEEPASTIPATAPADGPAVFFERQKQAIKLPGAVDDVCVGGGGRYLIAQLKTLKQVAIVDVADKKVVKYLPIDDDQFRIAAGKTKLIVAMCSKNMLTRYDLATGNREETVALVGPGIEGLAMGAASEGPLFIGHPTHSDLTPVFLDLRTLKPLKIESEKNHVLRIGRNVCVSADGSVFGSWTDSISPTGLHVIVLRSNRAEYYNEHNSVGMVIPGPDGRVIYTGHGMYTPLAEPFGGRTNHNYATRVLLPASSGPLYLEMTVPTVLSNHNQENLQSRLTLHLQGETAPILTINDVDLPETPRDLHPAGVGRLRIDRRLFLLPAANAIVTIPTVGDQLIVQRFQLNEELAKSNTDYLLTVSVPPASLQVGEKLQYQIDGKSKRGGIKYRLESGPPGMTVSPTGMVEWQAVNGENEVVVIVALSDASNQVVFHTFKMRIETNEPQLADASSKSSTTTPKVTPKATASAPPPVLSGTAPPSSTKNLRIWKSSDGMFTLEAELKKVADQTVTLLRGDGRTIEVPLDKLSKEDQEYVQKNLPADAKQ